MLTAETMYYWTIGVYDSSSSTPDVPIWSPIFTFYAANNLAPDVNAGPDVDSWLVDVDELIDGNVPPDAERVVQLNGSVTDDGYLEPYTVLWTVVSQPNSPTYPEGTAVIDPNNIVNPTITMTALPGLYELELEAYDGEHTSSDTIDIQLYDTYPARTPGIKRDLSNSLVMLIAIAKSILWTLSISQKPGSISITAPSNEGINNSGPMLTPGIGPVFVKDWVFI